MDYNGLVIHKSRQSICRYSGTSAAFVRFCSEWEIP